MRAILKTVNTKSNDETTRVGSSPKECLSMRWSALTTRLSAHSPPPLLSIRGPFKGRECDGQTLGGQKHTNLGNDDAGVVPLDDGGGSGVVGLQGLHTH